MSQEGTMHKQGRESIHRGKRHSNWDNSMALALFLWPPRGSNHAVYSPLNAQALELLLTAGDEGYKQ